jgi:hypothetical protein
MPGCRQYPIPAGGWWRRYGEHGYRVEVIPGPIGRDDSFGGQRPERGRRSGFRDFYPKKRVNRKEVFAEMKRQFLAGAYQRLWCFLNLPKGLRATLAELQGVG